MRLIFISMFSFPTKVVRIGILENDARDVWVRGITNQIWIVITLGVGRGRVRSDKTAKLSVECFPLIHKDYFRGGRRVEVDDERLLKKIRLATRFRATAGYHAAIG